jgi:hypothetical protein
MDHDGDKLRGNATKSRRVCSVVLGLVIVYLVIRGPKVKPGEVCVVRLNGYDARLGVSQLG